MKFGVILDRFMTCVIFKPFFEVYIGVYIHLVLIYSVLVLTNVSLYLFSFRENGLRNDKMASTTRPFVSLRFFSIEQFSETRVWCAINVNLRLTTGLA